MIIIYKQKTVSDIFHCLENDYLASSVAIVRTTKNPNRRQIIRSLEKLFSLLGGINQVIKQNSQVLLKPNLAFKIKTPTTSDPEFIAALIEVIKNKTKARVLIAEGSVPGHDTLEVCEYNGLKAVCDVYDVPFIDLNRDERIKTKAPNHRMFPHIELPKTLLESDFVISVPQMKTHCNTRVTLGIKNMKGVQTPIQKQQAHMKESLHESIVDLLSIARPNLTLINGIEAIEGLGPDYPPGKKVDLRLIIGGTDPVATDSVACKIMGFDVKEEVDHVHLAAKRGLGVINQDQISICGIPLEKAIRPFEKPPAEMAEIPYLQRTEFIDGKPCSACVGGLFWILTILDENKDLDKLKNHKIALGSKAYKLIRDKQIKVDKDTLLIGRCVNRLKDKGTFIPGCPPTPAEWNILLKTVKSKFTFD